MSADNLTSVPRQFYYDQQLLKLEDFQREQDYHIALRELQTRLSVTPGIVTGLGVAAGTTATTVKLAGGVAIDAGGRLIMLVDVAVLRVAGATPLERALSAGDFSFDLNDARYYTINQPRTWHLTIAFGEQTVAPNQSQQLPVLQLSETVSTDPAVIPLADLAVKATQAPAEPAPGTKPDPSPQTNPPPPVMITTVTVVIDTKVAVKASFAAALMPALPATKITGALTVDQLPNIPATKITGALDPGQITGIPASAITGVLGVDQVPTLPATRISGAFEAAQLPDIPVAKITGVMAVDQLPDIPAAKIAGALTDAQLPDIPAAKITGALTDAQLPNIPAAKITGPLTEEQLPAIPAAKITGALTADQLPEIPAAKITGALTDAQLPNIPAAKITGPLTEEQLPAIPAAKIAGPLSVDQLPSLPAAKISGELDAAQLPMIPPAKIAGVLAEAQIPIIPATKISGGFSADQLPAIPAAKLEGVLGVDQLPTVPPTKIAAPLTAEQIPLLAELLHRVQTLETALGGLTTLSIPVTRGLNLTAAGLEAHWAPVPAASQYEIYLLSEPNPLESQPRVEIQLLPPYGQTDDAHLYPRALLTGIVLPQSNVLTFRVRALAGASASGWSDNTASSTVAVPTPSHYADTLSAAGLTAQAAAAQIARLLGANTPAAGMLPLLASDFASSMATATQKAWALANAGCDATSVASALAQSGVALPDMAAALKAVYPPPDVAGDIQQLRFMEASAASAASSLKAAHPDLTALQLGVVLVRNFPAGTRNATQLAIALKQAGYTPEQISPVIPELFPLLGLAGIAAVLRAAFGT